MNKKEWQQFHGFSDEDVARIDDVKKIFNGAIQFIITKDEMDKYVESLMAQNKINIDRLWMK